MQQSEGLFAVEGKHKITLYIYTHKAYLLVCIISHKFKAYTQIL